MTRNLTRYTTYLMATTVALSMWLPLVSHAQGLNQTSPSSNAGAIQQHFQKNPTATKTAPDAEAPPEPEIIDEQAPPPQDPSLSRKFPVDEIIVADLKVLDEDEIESLVAPYRAQGLLNFLDLQELADALTDRIRDKGFVTSRVYIPPQKIADRTVTLQGVEGTVGDVEFMERRHFRDRSVEPRFRVGHGVLNNANLRRQLRRINTNPDLNVAAVLQAGQNPDETDIELRPTYENHPYHASLFWDNLGRYQIGKKRLGATVTHNNLLGLGDTISNTVGFSRRSFSTVTQYKVPVGPWGTKLNMDYAHSRIRLGEDGIAALNIKGDVNIYSPYISQELINTDHHLLSVDLGMDFKNVNTNGANGGIKFVDRVRTLRAALNYEESDRLGRTYWNNEVAFGFDWLGGRNSTPEPGDVALSRARAGSQFVRYTGAATRVQKMPFGTTGVFRAMGQATPDRLPPIEQFQLGGAFTVRGYTEGELIGDQGLMVSGEWHVPFFVLPRSWHIPGTGYSFRDNIQLVTFMDAGAIYSHRTIIGEQKDEVAWGMGIGLRARLTKLLTARVDLGIPLLRQPTAFSNPAKNRQANPRLHFGLETQLF